jgi:hypothetical protein
MLHVDLHTLHAHEVVSKKSDFFVAYVEKIKIGAKISLFTKLFFVFLYNL